MAEDPITLIASFVLIVSMICMGGIAKDHVGAKGVYAYWLVCSGGIFHYIEITRKNNNRIGFLFWIFVTALLVVIYKKI